MNFLSAPFFSLRRSARSGQGHTPNIGGGVTHTPEKLNELLRASLPAVRSDTLEISEVARRKAQGEVSWAPESNTYKTMLQARQESVRRQTLKDLKTESLRTRRRVWSQAVTAGKYGEGNPSYDYVVGSDQKLYVEGATVPIDSNAVANDPQATRKKARELQSIFLKPGRRGRTDFNRASRAIQLSMQAGHKVRETDRPEDTLRTELRSDDMSFSDRDNTQASYSEAFSLAAHPSLTSTSKKEHRIERYQQFSGTHAAATKQSELAQL